MAASLNSTTVRLIDAGCRVAWVAAEGFPWVDLDPDSPIASLGENVVQALREYSTGLSDMD